MRLNICICVNIDECICGNRERDLDTLDKISIRRKTPRGHFSMVSQ